MIDSKEYVYREIGWKMVLKWVGEGLDGDYDPSDPEDEKLLFGWVYEVDDYGERLVYSGSTDVEESLGEERILKEAKSLLNDYREQGYFHG